MPDGVVAPQLQVDVWFRPEERAEALRADVRRGLTATHKQLSPQWFYDERGSQLFDEITRLPEYYLTDRERDLLRGRAVEVAELTEANTLVELGSGTSEKTRLLMDALARRGTLRRYVPFDVSEETLRDSAAAIVDEYEGIEVHGVVGDFHRHLSALPEGRRRLVAFLGSTIGNLMPTERTDFVRSIGDVLTPGESLLLGADLVKDVARLEAAYNDSAGVTAAFNKNVLHVLNRELGADFDPDRFEHVARWNDAEEWIEMLLRSTSEQTVRIRELDLEVRFAAGEDLRTEISAKFRRERLERELADASFAVTRWWEHETGDFALLLARDISPAG
jgi:L-histidine N-alpha-methyltransferase